MKVALVPLVLVPALGAVQGGFNPDAWVWSGALVAWAAAVAVVVTRNPGALRTAWPWAACCLGLLLWTVLSTSWSARPAQSLLEARRTIVYAAAVLALLLLVRRAGTRALVLATHAAIVGLLLYALVAHLLGERRYDPFEGFLLSAPVGYANGVGILSALGSLLGLGIAASADSRSLRAAAAATVPVLGLALVLTGSDASWLALGAGLAVAALLDPAPMRWLTVLAVTTPPTAVVVWLGSYSRYTAANAEPRIAGYVLLLAAAGGAAIAASAAAWTRTPRSSERVRLVVLAAVLCVVLGGAAAVARAGSTEPRASYWHVAWREYQAHPVLGSGAGTFGYYWARSGKPVELGGALDAHSLYLELLAELGPVGLLLLGGFLLFPLRAVRQRATPLVPAALGAYAAFLVHAALDWDWELPAVVVGALCCGAAALAAGRRDERPLAPAVRAAVLVVALVLAACAIAGARSNAVPSAKTAKAPQSGAFARTEISGRRYLPWP